VNHFLPVLQFSHKLILAAAAVCLRYSENSIAIFVKYFCIFNNAHEVQVFKCKRFHEKAAWKKIHMDQY
jgi:hypothetical protein